MRLKFIDLFGGIGGFRHGLEQTSKSFECVKYIEKDKYAVKSYNEIFKEEHEPTDVTQLDTNEIPDFNILCAGFPCQSFSIAGKRKGFEDTRGTLFFEIARIAEAKKPEILFLENVKGLLSHDNGRTFGRILETLDELGYYVEWQVLNSKHWGVPQNRERVFIIGHLGGEPRSKVFPLTREAGKDSEKDGREDKLDTIHPNRPEIGQAERVYSNKGLLPALNSGWTPQIKAEEREIKCVGNVNPSGRGMNGKVYKASEDAVMPTVSTNKGEGHKILNPLKDKTDQSWYWEQIVYSENTDLVRSLKSNNSKMQPKVIQNHRNIEIRDHGQVSPTLNKKQGGGQLPMVLNHQFRPKTRPSIEEDGQSGGSGLLYNSSYSYTLTGSPHFLIDDKLVKPCLTPDRVNKRQNGRRMKEDNDPMFTLTSQDVHGVKSGTQIRKLTPKECWRLQGFPDSSFNAAEKVNSDTQLYKQSGNAVTVNVINAISEKILDILNNTR